MENKSTRKMLNKSVASIDLWGTPKTISIHVLYELLILVLCFLFNKYSRIDLNAGKLEPYVVNVAINRS